MKIGKIETKNNIFLAPMAGVSDLPFRIICRSMGASVAYSEMVSAKGLLYKNRNTFSLLDTTGEDGVRAVQLFGADPEIMAAGAQKAEELNVDIIDINMGCPVPKVVKNGEGSALMKNPRLAGEIISAVAKSVKLPVTVKIRKGFDEKSINAVELAKTAEASGASAITVHGRTANQFYSGKADWDIIGRVKDAVSIPVIGNGDVDSPEEAERLLSETGCDGVMIGRRAMGYPWIFRETEHYFKTGGKLCPPTPEEKIKMALYHGKRLIEYKGEYVGIREMRKHVSWYIKGMNGAAVLRTEVNRAVSYEEFEKLLNDYLSKIS